MKILLGDFNSKVGREDIFKPKLGMKVFTKLIMINGVRLVNFATSKNLPTSIHILGRLQMGKATIRLTIFW
jgi:hypothetical protein